MQLGVEPTSYIKTSGPDCRIVDSRLSSSMADCAQDRMSLMGWPCDRIDTANISAHQYASLVGEGLHLGCLGTVVYLVFLSESAPWWGRGSNLSFENVSTSVVPAAGSDGDARPARRRRIGSLAPRISLS